MTAPTDSIQAKRIATGIHGLDGLLEFLQRFLGFAGLGDFIADTLESLFRGGALPRGGRFRNRRTPLLQALSDLR